MPDDATEGVAKDSFRLQPINLHAQLQPLCSAALVLKYYPKGMKAQVSPVQSIEPHRILAPTRDLNQGSKAPLPIKLTICTITQFSTLQIFPQHTWPVHILPQLRQG